MEYNLLVLAPGLRVQWLCGPLGLHSVLLGDLSFPCPSEQGEVLVEKQLTPLRSVAALGVGAWEEAQCEGNDHSRRRLWKEALCIKTAALKTFIPGKVFCADLQKPRQL